MAFDVHPILVHFPVALLSLYPFVEAARFTRLKQKPWIVPLKTFLVVAGTLGAAAAGLTGELAAEALAESRLIEVHSSFAQMTFAVGAVLSFGYVVTLLRAGGWSPGRVFKGSSAAEKVWAFCVKVADRIVSAPVAVPGSILLLALIVITGSLGGALVYGPDIDPAVAFVYRVFVGQ